MVAFNKPVHNQGKKLGILFFYLSQQGFRLLIILSRHGRNTPIPFGPYLAAAGIIALFWGAQLTRSYLGLMA